MVEAILEDIPPYSYYSSDFYSNHYIGCMYKDHLYNKKGVITTEFPSILQLNMDSLIQLHELLKCVAKTDYNLSPT